MVCASLIGQAQSAAQKMIFEKHRPMKSCFTHRHVALIASAVLLISHFNRQLRRPKRNPNLVRRLVSCNTQGEREAKSRNSDVPESGQSSL